ncbi:peptidylprolyl isomerase [Litoreibacter halocynthiae]|uniref:Peptidyl-prolyl cis-trans isomerase n=1 Tax=Litoreibacter halocynthiae TaxID=1242689 RepID=A0A4R7LPD8_9RHOB|nr:peptidylprolyl isomerase [Litoreibacter halocynthiae]
MADIKDPENTILMELTGGTVAIELLPDVAPQHTARMKELARSGAYNNVAFHRVIDGFMAQTGDVANGNMEKDFNIRMAGTGGSEMPDVPAEFSKLPHDRGTIGAARSANPNSANSQFFINFSDNNFLNGQYTVYGRVIEGMEHVDAIQRGEPPMNPDRMISVMVAADAGGAAAPADDDAAEPEAEADGGDGE